MNLTQISAATVFYGSVLMLVLLALPSLIGAIRQAGIIKTALLFGLLAALIIGYETLAVKSGVPYGSFSYGTTLGRKLFGTTPWIVALIYPPLVIGSFWLAKKISEGVLSILFASIFITFCYVIIAPVMARLNIWVIAVDKGFFGVPFRGFAGWYVCALIASVLTSVIWKRSEIKRLSAYSLFLTLLFWSGANFGVSNLVPGLIGSAYCVMLAVLFRIEKRQDQKTEVE